MTSAMTTTILAPILFPRQQNRRQLGLSVTQIQQQTTVSTFQDRPSEINAAITNTKMIATTLISFNLKTKLNRVQQRVLTPQKNTNQNERVKTEQSFVNLNITKMNTNTKTTSVKAADVRSDVLATRTMRKKRPPLAPLLPPLRHPPPLQTGQR